MRLHAPVRANERNLDLRRKHSVRKKDIFILGGLLLRTYDGRHSKKQKNRRGYERYERVAFHKSLSNHDWGVVYIERGKVSIEGNFI